MAYNTKNNRVYDATPDKDGHFRIAVDDFPNGTSFFLQAIDKRSRPVDSKIVIDHDTCPSVSPHAKYELQQSEYADSNVTVNVTVQGEQLPDIIVRARVRHDDHQSTVKFY